MRVGLLVGAVIGFPQRPIFVLLSGCFVSEFIKVMSTFRGVFKYTRSTQVYEVAVSLTCPLLI